MKKTLIVLLHAALLLLPVQIMALMLEIETDKTDYLLGEPVVLYVSLQNTSDKALKLPFLLDPISDIVNYHIKQPGDSSNETNSFKPFVIGEPVDPTKEFAPGELARGEVKLFYGADGWTFKQPSTYEITASMFHNKLSSNTLTITIHAPADEPTAEAAQLFLDNDDIGLFLTLEGGDFLVEAIQQLKQVATEYPNTPHATYANQALGTNLISGFTDLTTGDYRPADPANALLFLEKAQQQPMSFYDTLHTHLSLYEAHTQLNNTNEAESVIKALIQITRTEFEEFLPLLDDILNKVSKELSVDLSTFTATAEQEGIRLAWTVGKEENYVGYRIWRSAKKSDNEHYENAKLLVDSSSYQNSDDDCLIGELMIGDPSDPLQYILAIGNDRNSACYSFSDTTIATDAPIIPEKVYYYVLEDIDMLGNSTVHCEKIAASNSHADLESAKAYCRQQTTP